MSEVLQSISFDAETKRVLVDFCIRSDILVPTEITSNLGIEPSRSFAKNEEYSGKSRDPITKTIQKITRRRPWGIWAIDTKDLLSTSINDHLTFLINLLEPRKEQLKKYLDNKDEYTVSFYIRWEPKDGVGGGYDISSEMLAKLASLCHYVQFSFIATNEE